jgi:hypothetical protein
VGILPIINEKISFGKKIDSFQRIQGFQGSRVQGLEGGEWKVE